MASRLKEDERNERAIRNLLKLPENRRCINCNSLGPQYVCTSFWTFVCTTCSGIHREFTHRVKSVSMAKFTSQEVSALQGGGNASAKEIYFKEWDPQRQSFPDSSNVERLRDFIKHIYVDKRYTGEKSFDKPPRVKMGESEDSYQGGSRSPPFENERRYTERPSPGGRSDDRSLKNSYEETRSPGYDQDFRRSPVTARTDNIVNDWRREDRFGDGRRSEGRSPDHQRDPVMSSPPIVRPVRDILGEKAPPLRVIEPPKANGTRPSDGTIRTQRTASSSSLASSNGNPAELKTESSLIDFDTVPEPPSTTPPPQAQQSAPSPAPFATQSTTISNNNWANFDSVQEVKASNPPSNTNLLDVLSELSVPATQLSPSGTTAPVAAPISHPGGSQAATSLPSFNQWQNVHSQQNLLPAQSFNQAVGGSLHNQPGDPSLTGNTQVLSSSQVTHGVDVQPTAKKELPADLFTSNYSSFAAPGQGWYPAPQYGMGFNMQYNVPVFMPPAFQQPSNSSNPFDVNQSSPVQATTFPSMAPLQGALPNMVPPLGIQRTSSLGASLPAWNTNQSSHPLPSNIHRTSSLGTFPPTWMPPQGPSYGSGISSGPFMGQAPPNMPPPPRPQVGGFGSFNPSQQQSGLYYAPSSASHSFSSVGGNPFG